MRIDPSFAGFEDGREPQARECRQFLEAGKDKKKKKKKMDSLLELQQKNADLLTA